MARLPEIFQQLISLKRQIFDFVSGGIYSLSGKIQKVTKDIFILAGSLKEKEKSKLSLN